MQNRESALGPLLAATAAAIAIAIFVWRTPSTGPHMPSGTVASETTTTAQPAVTPAPAPAPAVAKPVWAVSAPGRVEPKTGDVRISPQAAGRIAEVYVSLNQKVVAGDMLIKLDDSDIEARLAAADAEASVRKRDRDTENVTGPARDRRNAEDAAFTAERLYSLNRAELDRWIDARKNGLATDADLAKARETVVKAREAMVAARAALRRSLADTQVAQTRLEAALSAARSELAAVDAAAERMRIRAPIDGTILQLNAVPGESVAPSPENIVVVMGDVSALRVKAEIEERDIGKLRIAQPAAVRSDAFPGREFEAKVTAFGQSLGPSRLGQKGPRRLADVDVLEVTLELTGHPPLLPGMRVDVFLKPDSQAASTTPTKTN